MTALACAVGATALVRVGLEPLGASLDAEPSGGSAGAWAKDPPERAIEDSVTYSGCNEVRALGMDPLYAGQPGYREDMDGDGDGIACEPRPD